jgi:transposase InsO family protein
MARHGKPEVFNTDQGSQFTGAAFTGVLACNGIAISMDGKGAWRDNVFVERLMAQRQIRGGVSESLRRRQHGPCLDRPLSRLLQRKTTALEP